MHSYIDSYPYLESLLGGWFHQDYDIRGQTLEEIMSHYKKNVPIADIGGLRADIERFLRHFPDELDQQFTKQFHPCVSPKQWSATTHDWLSSILTLLGDVRA